MIRKIFFLYSDTSDNKMHLKKSYDNFQLALACNKLGGRAKSRRNKTSQSQVYCIMSIALATWRRGKQKMKVCFMCKIKAKIQSSIVAVKVTQSTLA